MKPTLACRTPPSSTLSSLPAAGPLHLLRPATMRSLRCPHWKPPCSPSLDFPLRHCLSPAPGVETLKGGLGRNGQTHSVCGYSGATGHGQRAGPSGIRTIPEEDSHDRDSTDPGVSCRGCPWPAQRQGASCTTVTDLRSSGLLVTALTCDVLLSRSLILSFTSFISEVIL